MSDYILPEVWENPTSMGGYLGWPQSTYSW